MTRNEFDRQYAATQDNTEGYSDDELSEINEAVFFEVREVEDEDILDSHVKNMFAREMNACGLLELLHAVRPADQGPA